MRILSLFIAGILLSALLIVPAYAGPTDMPTEQPNKAKKHKTGGPAKVDQVKAGAQLNERGKRSEVRNKAAAMKKQMQAGGGQQSQ